MTVLSVLLVVGGLAGLSLFGFAVWPPLALLPFSAAALAGGLLVDWGSLRGKSSPQADRRR